jgi:hypothetical protein
MSEQPYPHLDDAARAAWQAFGRRLRETAPAADRSPPSNWSPWLDGVAPPPPPPGTGTLQRLREVAAYYPAEVLAVLWPLLAGRVAAVVERIVAERLAGIGHERTTTTSGNGRAGGTNGTAVRLAGHPGGG